MVKSWKKHLPKNFIIIGIILIILALISFFIFNSKKNKYPDSLGLYIKGSGYYLEVAQTDKDQQKGLSQRNTLCRNCGMFFVFNKEDEHSFWMKDTHIPLDMIWLDSTGKIVKIITNAQTDSEYIYTNDQAAKYVIELNADEALKLKLEVGDTIPLPSIDDFQE